MRKKNNFEQYHSEGNADELENLHQHFSRDLRDNLLAGRGYQAYKSFITTNEELKTQAKRLIASKDVKGMCRLAAIGQQIYSDWNWARKIFQSQVILNETNPVKKPVNQYETVVNLYPDCVSENSNHKKLPLRLNIEQKRILVTELEKFLKENDINYDKIDLLNTEKIILIEGMGVVVDALKRGLPGYALSNTFTSDVEIDRINEVIQKGFLRRNELGKKIDDYYYQFNNPLGKSHADSSLRDLAIKYIEFKKSFNYWPNLSKLDQQRFRQSIINCLLLKPDLDEEEKLVKKIELRQRLLAELYRDVLKWYKGWGVELPNHKKTSFNKASVIRTAFLSFASGQKPDGYWTPDGNFDKESFPDKSLNFLFFVWGKKIYQKDRTYRAAAVEYLSDMRDQIIESIEQNSPKIKQYLADKSRFKPSDIKALFGNGGLGRYLIVKIPEVVRDPSELLKLQQRGKVICIDNKWYPVLNFIEDFHFYSRLNRPEVVGMTYNDRERKYVPYMDKGYKINKQRPIMTERNGEKTVLISYQKSLLDQFIDHHHKKDTKSDWWFLAVESFRDFHEQMQKRHPKLKDKKPEEMNYQLYPEEKDLIEKLMTRLDKLGLGLTIE